MTFPSLSPHHHHDSPGPGFSPHTLQLHFVLCFLDMLASLGLGPVLWGIYSFTVKLSPLKSFLKVCSLPCQPCQPKKIICYYISPIFGLISVRSCLKTVITVSPVSPVVHFPPLSPVSPVIIYPRLTLFRFLKSRNCKISSLLHLHTRWFISQRWDGRIEQNIKQAHLQGLWKAQVKFFWRLYSPPIPPWFLLLDVIPPPASRNLPN